MTTRGDIEERHFRAPMPSSRVGHGYGNLRSDLQGSVAGKKSASFPYDETFEDLEPAEEIEDEDLRALQKKIGLPHYIDDPYMKYKQGKTGRYGPGMAAGPDLVTAGIARGAARTDKVPMDYATSRARMYRGRMNTVTGGTFPKVYNLRTGGAFDRGHLAGWSKPPPPLFKSRPVYRLQDLEGPDERAVSKVRADVERVLKDQ